MKNFLLILLMPILFSCQKYNKTPYDETEKNFRKVPDSMDRMSLDSVWYKRDSLTYLRFKNVKLMYIESDSIPKWIGQYKNLVFLSTSVDKKKFASIPKSIGNLTNLTSLNLSNGEILLLPDELYYITSLESFKIANNNISTLSKRIGELKNLRSIYLSNNPLIVIPLEICELNNLESLVLEHTKISTLPKCLSTMPNLTWINVSQTELKEFPIEILNAPKLETIHARGLKLENYQEVKEICEGKNITFYYDE